MRIREWGKVCNQVWRLGNAECCVYLIHGSRRTLMLNGGLAALVPQVLDQLRQLGRTPADIDVYLIMHSHFDHNGCVPYFKRQNPAMTVYASRRAVEVLRKPAVVESINRQARFAIDAHGLADIESQYELGWWPEMPIKEISEGDSIDLGDLHLEILETPGHAPCCISAYIPELKMLFPSDSAAIPFGDKFLPYGTSNFIQFQASLHKLEHLPVEYLCSDHYAWISGDEARGYIGSTIVEAERRRRLMLEAYERCGTIDAAAEELATQFQDESVGDLMPWTAFLDTFRAMVRVVVAHAGGGQTVE
jgi:glyoxylase-like metal-dependent hydrolase (beta-lactamase superfamily II)